MQTSYDYRKFGVLYVDDEELSLRSFRRAFGETFRVYTASNAQEGMAILTAHGHELGLLMTDQRMPGEKGVWLLQQARQNWPRVVRVLVTAYTDSDAAVAAVNTGAIYNYILKPWDVSQLEKTLKRGLEFFMVEKDRDELLRVNSTLLQEMLMAERVASLGFLAAGMSHHIRNWLVAVKTFVEDAPEQLRRQGLDCQKLSNREFWTDLQQLAEAQIRKIENLLQELWSASKSGKTPVSDRVLARDVLTTAVAKLETQLAAKEIAVENKIPTSLPSLMVHQPSFGELFELLIEDEIASLPPGSAITLTGERIVLPGSAQVEVHVRLNNNGPCLPDQSLRRMFNFFAPRSDSPSENGIRLMLCYFIVLRHGGKISVTSEPGRGTTFDLTFFTPSDPATAADHSPVEIS
jgi:two-component system probable response regulator PhcQ